MANGKERDRRLEAQWRRTIREHVRSGMTIRAFCRTNNLPESGFHFWRRELGRRDLELRKADQKQRNRPSSQAAFVPVRVATHKAEPQTRDAPTPLAGRVEIELPCGWRVLVTPPVDRQALTDVLAVLATASPRRQEGRPC